MGEQPVLWSQFVSWLLRSFPFWEASVNKTRRGEVLIALSSRVHSCKRRYDLESRDECVWVEMSTFGSRNLPIVNHYFPLTLNLKSLIITFDF
jgi:hypothetical protein